MSTSVFIARLIGPVMLVIGLAVFTNQRAFRDMAEEFLASRALLFLSGLLIMPVGLAIVLTHNIWAADGRVPLREIMVSEGAGEQNLSVYDTSGPYTDPAVTIDVNKGLPRNRTAWVLERGGAEAYEGRSVKPVDNGNVSPDKAAKAFSAFHRPLRGIDAPSVPSPLP